jgi:6-O-methylguanine DNA methyltransferase, DNA binding domain
MKTRKSWREKMNNPNLPKVVEIPPRMQKRHGSGTMVVPSPRDVEAIMRSVKKGAVTTVGRLRRDLAAKFSTDVACPMATGMFVRLAAEAAEEEAAAGKARITPYWRVVRDDGSLNPKFPGGAARQAERLRGEGHTVLAGKIKHPPRLALEEVH